jgi:hypothetical protein
MGQARSQYYHLTQWPDHPEQLATKQLNLSIRIDSLGANVICTCKNYSNKPNSILTLFDTLIGKYPIDKGQLWPLWPLPD